jgi:hypothetical protein
MKFCFQSKKNYNFIFPIILGSSSRVSTKGTNPEAWLIDRYQRVVSDFEPLDIGIGLAVHIKF